MDRIQVLAKVCAALETRELAAATSLLLKGYPFVSIAPGKRKFRQLPYTRVFIRDGFIDRYSGEQLVFPPVLRLLSHALPEQFPYHSNWKMEVTHPAYWQLSATVDHLVPIAASGADDPSNWVTTSMAHNSAKMNWTLAELRWELKPPGDFRKWDGLLNWSLRYAERHPDAVSDNGVRAWLRAGSIAITEAMSRCSTNEAPGTDRRAISET